MNYLAHAFLSDSHPESLLGNLMADFIKGRMTDALSDGIQAGVRLHRRIDAFTDAHPVFVRSCDRIRGRWRRYSGILMDMFYDHFLAAEWPVYSDRSLREFADHVYDVLRDHAAKLPEPMRHAAERMIHYDWLVSYADLEKLEVSLNRLSRRSRNAELHLDTAMADLREHYSSLKSDFHAFFPELVRFASGCHREADGSSLNHGQHG